jgi:hypothetical protein
MTDSYVQVAPDSTGKKIDNSELTYDDGVIAYRQRTVIASDNDPGAKAEVKGEEGKGYLLIGSDRFDELLEKMDEIISRMDIILGEI